MEEIVAHYIDALTVPDMQNITETFTSISGSITFSGFKVRVSSVG
jgi:hypothetical protein